MKRDFSHQVGQRIAIHGKSTTQYVDIADITHICCEDSIVTTHTKEQSITANKQLKEFEEELQELGFLRINRNTLINEAHIKSYKGGESKSVELNNGEHFPVSRRKAYLFK